MTIELLLTLVKLGMAPRASPRQPETLMRARWGMRPRAGRHPDIRRRNRPDRSPPRGGPGSVGSTIDGEGGGGAGDHGERVMDAGLSRVAALGA